MALLRIDTTAEVLPGLTDVNGLYLIRSNVDHLGDDRYRVFGYASETVIPELEAHGCQVRVLMGTEDTERFNNEIRAAMASSDADQPSSET